MSDALKRAEDHLRRALELLDSVAAPADVGAYVDLAIHRLQDFQEQSGEPHTRVPGGGWGSESPTS